jgi:2-amino-4-hydroxy-6-hydroxymethyldihydropteridine diphosphokinase
MIKVFLSLGTNLGNKKANLSTAISEIEKNIGHITLYSGIYETEAWGFECEYNFLNQVILVMTDMEPSRLINSCLAIEKKMGRERKKGENYESRIIDIDILFYGESIVAENNLTIPHPQLHKRKFILEPLNEIAPDLVHPLLGKSVWKILEECADSGSVKVVLI